MTVAEESLHFSRYFEAELLVELMLRFWKHPYAEDSEFRNSMIENAHEVLQRAVSGEHLIEGVPPNDMNLVVAVWYAEWSTVSNQTNEDPSGERARWLNDVRSALPSCFCRQNELPPG